MLQSNIINTTILVVYVLELEVHTGRVGPVLPRAGPGVAHRRAVTGQVTPEILGIF